MQTSIVPQTPAQLNATYFQIANGNTADNPVVTNSSNIALAKIAVYSGAYSAISIYAPATGELVYDTTHNALFVGIDGVTPISSLSAAYFTPPGFGTPTVAGGSALGSGGSYSAPTISGIDKGFSVSCTTGNSTGGTGSVLFTATFGETFTSPPVAAWTAANLNGISIAGTAARALGVSTTTTQLTFTFLGTTPLPLNTAYIWNFVLGI